MKDTKTESPTDVRCSALVRRTATRLWCLTNHLPNHAEQYPAACLWVLAARAKTLTLKLSIGCGLAESWRCACWMHPWSVTAKAWAWCRQHPLTTPALPPSGPVPDADGGRPVAVAKRMAKGFGRLKLSNLKRLLCLLQRGAGRLAFCVVGDKSNAGAGKADSGFSEGNGGGETVDRRIFHKRSAPNDQAER